MNEADPLEITENRLPAVRWAKEWRAGFKCNYQGLFTIKTREGFFMGVRVTLLLDLQVPDLHSYGTAEVFDGTRWNAVASLPAVLMKTWGNRGQGVATWDETGATKDCARLLEDTRQAYLYRAMGSDEMAALGQHQVMVTYDPQLVSVEVD